MPSKNPRIPSVAESRTLIAGLLKGGNEFAKEQRRADEFNANFQQKQAVHADNLAHQRAQEQMAQEHLALAKIKSERERAEALERLSEKLAKAERSVVALEQMAAFRLNIARIRTDDPDFAYHVMKLRSDYSFAATDPETKDAFNGAVDTLEKAAKKTQDAYADAAGVIGMTKLRSFWNPRRKEMDSAGLAAAVAQQVDRIKNTTLPDDAKLQYSEGKFTITRGPDGAPTTPGGVTHAVNLARPGVRQSITNLAKSHVAEVMKHAKTADISQVPDEYLRDVRAVRQAGGDPEKLAMVRENIFHREYNIAAQNEGMFQHTEQHARDEQYKNLSSTVNALTHALGGPSVSTEARTAINAQLDKAKSDLAAFTGANDPSMQRDATYGGNAPAQPAQTDPNLPAQTPQQTILNIQVPKMEAPKPPAPAVQPSSINQ